MNNIETNKKKREIPSLKLKRVQILKKLSIFSIVNQLILIKSHAYILM